MAASEKGIDKQAEANGDWRYCVVGNITKRISTNKVFCGAVHEYIAKARRYPSAGSIEEKSAAQSA